MRIAVIGSGFAGLSAAACLAKEKHEVIVFEKNDTPGGRARCFTDSGFTFDMGPSWYWMPDVFDRYFARFGKQTSSYYQLKRLDPSYRIYYGKDDFMDLPASMAKLEALFEAHEPGSSRPLQRFLREAQLKYEIGVNKLVYKPGLSWLEFADRDLLTGLWKLHVFQSVTKYLRTFFKHPRLIKLLEFPVLFLGATAENTPALYTLMNYADMSLGTWYPVGGMHAIVSAMERLAVEQGVTFRYGSSVEQIPVEAGHASIVINGALEKFDVVVAAADYHHVEQELLPSPYRRYTSSYWESRSMAPSALLFYLGFDKRVKGLLHHTLFFDEDFTRHSKEIYEAPQWPSAPQFYVSCTSQTDPDVAPEGCENVVILVPVAPGLEDTESIREKYYELIMKRLESITGQSLLPHVVFKRSYAHRDFQSDYNSFKGNAYGLANTLQQTALFKPSIQNKKVRNLFYTGQLTVPGPGVPPSLISGQVVADHILARQQTVLT